MRDVKRALACEAGGFIGAHLVKRLKREGFWGRGADLKYSEYSDTEADDFAVGDLRDRLFCQAIMDTCFDEVYQLAADMGGAGYIFTGEDDADVMHNSATINLNIIDCCRKRNIEHVFYSSSACIYPAYNQVGPTDPLCSEDSTDSEYGWEKLFSECPYPAYRRNHRMLTHIGPYHNIFGPEGTWAGGKEKVPAALCRKIALARRGDTIEIWGDGNRTRSFLYVDECLEGTTLLLRSNFPGPVNVDSEEMVTMSALADGIADISGKRIEKGHVDRPQGVRGRNSDNPPDQSPTRLGAVTIAATRAREDLLVDRAASLPERASRVARNISSSGIAFRLPIGNPLRASAIKDTTRPPLMRKRCGNDNLIHGWDWLSRLAASEVIAGSHDAARVELHL